MSPTIFNVVIYAVIQYLVTVVPPPQEGAGKESLGISIQALLALFYANDVSVASPKSARLQGAFDALTGLFDLVDLRTNKGKTVSMTCRPCHTPHTCST